MVYQNSTCKSKSRGKNSWVVNTIHIMTQEIVYINVNQEYFGYTLFVKGVKCRLYWLFNSLGVDLKDVPGNSSKKTFRSRLKIITEIGKGVRCRILIQFCRLDLCSNTMVLKSHCRWQNTRPVDNVFINYDSCIKPYYRRFSTDRTSKVLFGLSEKKGWSYNFIPLYLILYHSISKE